MNGCLKSLGLMQRT